MAVIDDCPQLIAHRGYSECYPENTLVGLEAALSAGANCVELDVQFSSDGVPVVMHDNSLKRTTGMAGLVTQSTAAQLANLYASEKQRFGDQFSDEPIPTLTAALRLLDRWPGATAFVEIKEKTIEVFGVDSAAQRLVSELALYGNRCVLISFNYPVLVKAKRLGIKRTGWVIHKWNDESLRLAQELRPDVLLCDYKIIPDSKNILWQGSWRWAVYDVIDADVALQWIRSGVDFIETWDVGGLLGHKELASTVCFNK